MADLSVLRAQLEEGRAFFRAGNRYSVLERQSGLRRLHDQLVRNQDRICAALYADLGKSDFEARITEIIPWLEALKFLIRGLPRLARLRRVGLSLFNWPGRGRLRPEPYGQVLIFGTWNYPLLLALDPLAAAVAAWNRVLLKLSPQAPATAQIITELVENSFSGGEVTVLPRELDFDTILGEPFDYIFFTGNPQAGREVLRRAAENLTPVTLELGGKSPCVVDRSAHIPTAARRIVWGKFLNAGQTCVAPDYLLVHSRVKSELLNEIRACVKRFYGDNPAENKDFPRIVNDTHFERLLPLMEKGRLITGGEKNRTTLYIAPTVIDQITPEDPVMQQEIFGPILPVLEISSVEEAAAFINDRPKPLALYYFGSRKNREKLLSATSSGGVCVNETVMHLVNPSMPFGGVGASGMGAYHGQYGFDTFTHYKPELLKWNGFELPLRYPPVTDWKRWLVRLFCR